MNMLKIIKSIFENYAFFTFFLLKPKYFGNDFGCFSTFSEHFLSIKVTTHVSLYLGNLIFKEQIDTKESN